MSNISFLAVIETWYEGARRVIKTKKFNNEDEILDYTEEAWEHILGKTYYFNNKEDYEHYLFELSQ